MLKSFFAVTRSGSLYEIALKEKEGRHLPLLRKLALHRGSKSVVEEGSEFEEGAWLLITRLCLVFYLAEDIDFGNIFLDESRLPLTLLGFNTSPPIGLFLSFDEAWEAWRESEGADNSKIAAHFMEKWRARTEETLAKIGEDHPCIRILGGKLSLREELKNNFS